jgi:uncharacterized protein YbjT (DUF2867 family)
MVHRSHCQPGTSAGKAAAMDRLITLVGGSGFVGRAATETLARAGWRVRIMVRNAAAALRLKQLGDLGQVQVIAGDIRSPANLAAAMAGAHAAINFVGILKPAGGAGFDAIHATGAGNAAAAAAAAGVAQFIHVSAIGADATSPSAYGRSKGLGEAAVRAAFPAAAIVRPSLIFGAGDQFTNRFAALIAALPVVPVIAPGTRFQPVYVNDVADALAAVLAAGAGGSWDLAGPDVLTMRAINEFLAGVIHARKPFVDVPDVAARGMAQLGFLPGAPITNDQYLMLQRDNVADPALPGLADLGIVPTPMAAVAAGWLARYRRGGRFAAQAA